MDDYEKNPLKLTIKSRRKVIDLLASFGCEKFGTLKPTLEQKKFLARLCVTLFPTLKSNDANNELVCILKYNVVCFTELKIYLYSQIGIAG